MKLEMKNNKKETECNCPICTKGNMKQGEVYRCKKNGGAIMGVCEPNSLNIPSVAIQKVFIDYYDNEKLN